MNDKQDTKQRARELGLDLPGTTGTFNAITDIAGVRVGYCTLTDSQTNVRTGVTAILPREDAGDPLPVQSGQFSLNGNGEMTGTHWINDSGHFIGPICITNTHAVGMVHHAVTKWMINRYRDHFKNEHRWAMPVVAETYDGVLNDINEQPIGVDHTFAALESATSGRLAEGSVGGGNGMITYEFKGGTGTSSRIVNVNDTIYTVAALVQANHGIRPWLQVLGVPVGQYLIADRLLEKEHGSVIVIIATDAPLSPLSLRHLAKRASIGIGRGGTSGGNSSGDIFLAFSTATGHSSKQATEKHLVNHTQLDDSYIDPIYTGSIEAIEESVLNALVAGEDVETFKPKGKICRAIDTDLLIDLMRRHGRLVKS